MSRPTVPGGAFTGGALPGSPVPPEDLTDFVKGVGDARYADKTATAAALASKADAAALNTKADAAITMDGQTKSVPEWLSSLKVQMASGVSTTPTPTTKNAAAIWLSEWTTAQPVLRVAALGNPVDYWLVGDARQSYNVTGSADRLTARIEVRSGNQYSIPGYTDPATSERVEMFLGNPSTNDNRMHPMGQDCAFEYDLTLSGSSNTAQWCSITQVHAGAAIDGPALTLIFHGDDRLKVVTNAVVNGTRTETTRWHDPAPWGRGVKRRIRLEWRLNTDVTGYVRLWINGVQVLDWSGTIGAAAMTSGRLSFGCYRQEAPETFVGVFEPIGVKIGASYNTFRT